MFWSSYSKDDSSFETWRNKEVKLTALHTLSLLSHSKVGNTVKLFSYQKIVHNLPVGVSLVDADEVYPADVAFDALQRGHFISHVADLVKLRDASLNSGIVIDMDAVILRQFPDRGFLCSMPAKFTGAFAPRWGEAHPPLTVVNNSWDGKALSAFPASVDDSMRHYIYNISKTIEEKLKDKPKTGTENWNYMIWALKAIPNQKNEYHVFPPLYTCPVPAWLSKGKCYSLESPTRFDGKTKLFGYRMPSIKEILTTSFCVQHFFESVFKGDNRTGQGFWSIVKEGSLLAAEAEHVVGKEWRDVLNES